jgi:prepilin-type N-terminal cleavage/methylation domain-containing protein
MSKKLKAKMSSGFTLIELMIVMSVVALLMGMVGPLAINSLEKAEAKQEMLTMKNWFRKVSYRAFSTQQAHILKLSGKKVELFLNNTQFNDQGQTPILSKTLKSLFFQPQELIYSAKGFVSPGIVEGLYRDKVLKINLKSWVNGEDIKP